MLNADTLTKMDDEFETRITKEKDHLTELDRVIGDSDHGNNMERGVEAIKAAFENPTDYRSGSRLQDNCNGHAEQSRRCQRSLIWYSLSRNG